MLRPLYGLAVGACLSTLLVPSLVAQQRLLQPMPSPRAGVSQVIGLTHVDVDYSRPGVKGRQVMGNPQIVPTDDPMQPWRAGADENTVVTFEHDVTIEGKPLAAGSYGLHMFPSSHGPWTVAFSRDTDSWGSYSYDPSRDALRVQVTAGDGAFLEWLQYEFHDLTADGATLVLHWENTEVPMHIGVDTKAVMVDYLSREYVRGYGFWDPSQLVAAAAWCDQNDVNLEQALVWATRATQTAPDFSGLTTRASLESKLGRKAAAEATRAQAEAVATESQRNALGYQYLQTKEVGKAIAVFEANVKHYPESWNAHDSLAEACAAAGDTSRALQEYARAFELASDATQKTRIKGSMASLGG